MKLLKMKKQNNDQLSKEMSDIIKIKCDKCEKILNYNESLCHFH